jgi:hypothetical protein
MTKKQLLHEFLRFEWKKMIIPIILIAIMLFFMNYFYAFGSIADRYICDTFDLMEQSMEYRQQNNTESLLAVEQELIQNTLDMRNETEKIRGGVSQSQMYYLFQVFYYIDPFFPLSCEFIIMDMNSFRWSFCQAYISEKTYECSNEFIERDRGATTFFGQSNLMKYQGFNIGVFILNIAYLTVIGYIISCFVVFPLRKLLGKIRGVKE